MDAKDIRIGYCYIDGVYSFIRKVNDNGVVCFFKGKYRGKSCEKIDDFLKRKIEYR